MYARAIRRSTWWCLAVAAICGCTPAAPTTLQTLDVAPLTDTAKPLTTTDLKGQVVLINFWGTWCPPCRAELPHVVALADQYRDRGDFRLLSISSQGRGMEDMAQLKTDTVAFLKQRGFDIPVYADPLGRTRHGLAAVAAPGVFPATFLVDKSGHVVEGVLGYDERSFEQLKLKVAALLSETPAGL
jgi:thiol-disulfide isomerase/thioredoxin